ncbi:hypothetical protein CNR22_18375 [Sphingobacteriaceae bacterium]|nr:hypothetical protein CNR22_18375 [Sphingobacteriaceae bacterium]
MSAKSIIEDDWSDYDNLKITDGRDGRFFSCTEQWEVEYLRNKIKKYHTEFSDATINKAIQICCSLYKGQQPRIEFLQAVLMRLGLKPN